MVVLEKKLENNYIYRVFDNGIETWTLYDESGKLIHHKFSDGRETWQTYNEDGYLIYAKDKYLNGDIFEQWWEVDGFGKTINFRNSNGYTFKY